MAYPGPRPARYKVTIERFDARETPAAIAYPEDAYFLRLWHPLYEDFVDILPADMHRARLAESLTLEVAFHRPRRTFATSREVSVPDNAIMGVVLYARTANNHGQRCIKQNGVAKPEVSFWRVHERAGFVGEIVFQSAHLMSELRSGGGDGNTTGHAVKGRIGKLRIECIDHGRLVHRPYSGSNALIKSPELFRSTMMGMIRETYKPTFTSLREPRIPKLRDYFAPQYMTANGDVLPISTYMIRSCMADTAYPDEDALLRAFRACVEQRPEMGGEDEFVRVASLYLGSNSADPSGGDTGVRRKWFTCMEIVASMTCIYNNAVPYLMDMEQTGSKPTTTARPMPMSYGVVPGKDKYVDVERMVDAEKDYGHDCEDSSMNADMRKRAPGVHVARDKSCNPVLLLIARISNLFVSYVCQMACGGDDRQIVQDDSIFHFCTVLIPRAYAAKMEMVGGIPDADRRPIVGDSIRAWEYAYKPGYDGGGAPRGHVGVMYTEGTNTVCPMQFSYDAHVDSARTATARFMEGCAADVAEIEEWVCIYHANVFRKPGTLSGFYKYLICAISGDGPHHRSRGIYDYVFVDKHGPGGTYGVAVEMLARGDDGVALELIPNMRYSASDIEAIESHLTFRSMNFGTYQPTKALGTLGRLPVCPGFQQDDLIRGIPGVSMGAPHRDERAPDTDYHYIRISPMDVDLYDPARRTKIIKAIRCILSKGRDVIRGVHVSGHLVQYVPMEPNRMVGPTPLCALDVIIFFSPSSGMIGALRRFL